MYYVFHCPKCNEELTAEVDVGEHMVDWDEACDNCKYVFTDAEILHIYDAALADCFGSMIDYAHDMLSSR
jgi:transcription elongation factor Elf1